MEDRRPRRSAFVRIGIAERKHQKYHIEDYLTNRFRIDHLFDVAASSWNIGKKKPSLAAYQYVADQLAIKPEECLFVDDSENNVLAAREAGMRGIVFKNFDDFRERLGAALGETF